MRAIVAALDRPSIRSRTRPFCTSTRAGAAATRNRPARSGRSFTSTRATRRFFLSFLAMWATRLSIRRAGPELAEEKKRSTGSPFSTTAISLTLRRIRFPVRAVRETKKREPGESAITDRYVYTAGRGPLVLARSRARPRGGARDCGRGIDRTRSSGCLSGSNNRAGGRVRLGARLRRAACRALGSGGRSRRCYCDRPALPAHSDSRRHSRRDGSSSPLPWAGRRRSGVRAGAGLRRSRTCRTARAASETWRRRPLRRAPYARARLMHALALIVIDRLTPIQPVPRWSAPVNPGAARRRSTSF